MSIKELIEFSYLLEWLEEEKLKKDIKYMKDMILKSLNIPKEYLEEK